jgi:SPP1 gp7 family putative phage head morphogenesis protein
MCGFCDIENKEEEKINLFSDEEIENYIIGVYAGIYSVKNLDLSTYLKVARKLSQGVFSGYSKTLFDVQYGTEDWVMLRALQENVYIFSGAKQYQMLKEMSKGLTTGKSVTPFNEFKLQAKTIFEDYNENYLRAEYNSAIGQARTASRWQEYVKESNVLPMLTYQTAGDNRVRPTHELLDNISRPVNDPFWDKFMPPNGWNCRCIVIQNGSDTPKTSLKGFVTPSDVPPAFQFNAGKDKIVFSKKHPYFDIAPRDKKNAKQNFGMPLP